MKIEDHVGLNTFNNPNYLIARLYLSNDSNSMKASFELRQPSSVSKDTWSLIESYFDKLYLLQRYRDQSADEIAEIIATCRSHIDAGGSDVYYFLYLEIMRLENAYGKNHWKAVLMQTLSKHPNLQLWIESSGALTIKDKEL